MNDQVILNNGFDFKHLILLLKLWIHVCVCVWVYGYVASNQGAQRYLIPLEPELYVVMSTPYMNDRI